MYIEQYINLFKYLFKWHKRQELLLTFSGLFNIKKKAINTSIPCNKSEFIWWMNKNKLSLYSVNIFSWTIFFEYCWTISCVSDNRKSFSFTRVRFRKYLYNWIVRKYYFQMAMCIVYVCIYIWQYFYIHI